MIGRPSRKSIRRSVSVRNVERRPVQPVAADEARRHALAGEHGDPLAAARREHALLDAVDERADHARRARR